MLVLVLTLLAGQTQTKWEASAMVQARTRSGTPQDVGTDVSGDVELSPRAAATITKDRFALTGSYAPTLRSPEPWVLNRNRRAFADHSHVLGAELSWTKEAFAKLYVGEYFRYGLFDLSTLNDRNTTAQNPTPAPVNGVRQSTGSVTELTTDTSGGFDLYLTRRLTLATNGGFLYSGGADAASREALPLYSAPRVSSKLVYQASAVDTLSPQVGFQYIRFYQVPPSATNPTAREGARIFILELSTSYQHLFAEKTAVDLTVGVTGMFGQIPDPDNRLQNTTGVGPLLAAGIAHRAGSWRGQQLDLRADAKLAPFVDRQAGTVYNRVEGGAGVSWSNSDHFSASLGVGAARSLPVSTEQPLTTVSTDASFGYQGDPWWRVDLVARVAGIYSRPLAEVPSPPPLPAQMYVPPPLPSGWQNQFVVGLSFTAMIGSDQPRTFRE